MPDILSFEEALQISENYHKRHLLLGNGFSIACIPGIFTYGSLYNRASFEDMPEVQKVFELLDTRDFELVIQSLENSSRMLPAYLPIKAAIPALMGTHAQALKERLIQTIAQTHPAVPAEIPTEKYTACAWFLSHFLDRDSAVYSLNYDLLLYWTLMFAKDRQLIRANPVDGFGKDMFHDHPIMQQYDYVRWQGESTAYNQNVHYLHGALHLYDRGAEIEKLTWKDTGIPLIDQARQALSENRFPLFVTEGESEKKMEKITHSGYLYHSYKSFSKAMQSGTYKRQCLFTYGVSFGDNDRHILSKISGGKVAHLFVSIFGDQASAANQAIIASAQLLCRQRNDDPLQVHFYDAASARVWG